MNSDFSGSVSSENAQGKCRTADRSETGEIRTGWSEDTFPTQWIDRFSLVMFSTSGKRRTEGGRRTNTAPGPEIRNNTT